MTIILDPFEHLKKEGSLEDFEDGIEFPNIATRICAINRTNAKMIIKFYVVSMYRNLNIDIMNVAKILPTEEMIHLINGYANYQTAIIHENNKGMSDPDLTKAMVHNKIMNNLIDEETVTQIKEYIDSQNPYNLLRLIAPSIQYIRQNLDILPGCIYEIDLYDFAEELHEYFSFYALIVTSTPIITSFIMLSIVRSRCFEWKPQNQSL